MSVESVAVGQQVPRRPREIPDDGDGQPVRVTIIYPPEVIKRIQTIARHQGVAFSSLIRQWTIQRLDEEDRRERGQ